MKIRIDSLISSLKGKKTSKGWMALCPAHNDHNPSLSITQTQQGNVLWHCFAGCSQQEVYKALIEKGFLLSKKHTRR